MRNSECGVRNEAGSPLRASYDGSAAVELGDLPKVDCEGQRDLLTLAQTAVGSLYENTGRAEIDCAADSSPAAGK